MWESAHVFPQAMLLWRGNNSQTFQVINILLCSFLLTVWWVIVCTITAKGGEDPNQHEAVGDRWDFKSQETSSVPENKSNGKPFWSLTFNTIFILVPTYFQCRGYPAELQSHEPGESSFLSLNSFSAHFSYGPNMPSEFLHIYHWDLSIYHCSSFPEETEVCIPCKKVVATL